MLKLAILLIISVCLNAEEEKPTVEQLRAQLAEAKLENEHLTKLLNAWVQKFVGCDVELTTLKVLSGTKEINKKNEQKHP